MRHTCRLHVHAFFFCLMTLVILASDATAGWPRFKPVSSLLALLLWRLPLYPVLAMRRVFGRGWAGTLLGVFVYAMLQL